MDHVSFSFKVVIASCAVTLAAAAADQTAPMRVGFETNAEPMSSIGPDGQIQGFSVDLVNAIAEEMKFPVTPVVGPWEDLFARFKAGQVDVLASLAYTKERDEFIEFAVSHLLMKGAVFVRKGDRSIRTLADLATVRVGVQPHSFSHEYLSRRGWDRHLVFVDTFRDALHALDEGRCDAVAAVGIIGNNIIRTDKLQNVMQSDVAAEDFTYELHMGVRAGDSGRLALLNEGLARIRADGTYDKIHEKWIGPLEPRRVRLEDLQPFLLPAGLITFGILGALLWQRRLLHRVQSQAAALRESEQRLTLVLEGSDDGFWDWDLRSGRIDRSARTAAMVGYEVSEIPPDVEGWTKLIHPDDLPNLTPAEAVIADAEAGKRGRFDSEYRMRTKSGDWRWIHTRGKVVGQTADGQPLRIAGTNTDITDRKQTEAALRESERLLKRTAQLLEQTQSAAQIGGWEVDLRTDRLFWTEQTYRIHEVSPYDFQPTVEKAIQFYAEETRPIITAAVERAARDGTPYDLELEIVTARQRRVKVHTTGHAELENGRVVKIYGSFRDITDQKNAAEEREKLQQKMLEAQKLESLGVLAGGIAHDFNNLLTVILANASFARLDSSRPGSLNERLGHIETASRRAADMCNQMLAYSGRSRFIVERVDLNALVQDTVRLLQVSTSKDARIELALDPDLPEVEADVSQLQQVVMNLVLNAVEALDEKPGEIRLSTRRSRPELLPGAVTHAFGLPPGESICLEVADTGAGMTPATLARIFDPFFTTKFTGRGLGLAAVIGFVRAHEGTLIVHSTVGRGTRFRLYLTALPPPTPEPEVPVASLPTVQPEAEGHGAILVADDEAVVLATTDAVLRHYGYTTELAVDGLEAVARFRANPQGFVAVLLDLTMPGLSGAEVLRESRQLNPTVRVLLMSGYSEQDVLSRLEDQGVVAILHKPFTRQALLARIGEVIAGT